MAVKPNSTTDEVEPRADVQAGDEVFFQHAKGTSSGRVHACGKHGALIKSSGATHKVKWQHVLGAKKRHAKRYSVVEEGEDGHLVEDQHGRRLFLRIDNESREDPYMAKAMRHGRVLFLKSEYVGGAGLSKKQLTDKNGNQTTRWVKSTPDLSAPQAGHHVGFVNGEHKGHGVVKSAGKDGVAVEDAAGGRHLIAHDKITHRWDGEDKPTSSPHGSGPEKPNYSPREADETDKAYAKRVVDKTDTPGQLPEDHGRYFHTEGSTHVPLDKLHSTKSDDENKQGGDNGPKRMLAAYHGVLGKRDPITVMPHADKQGHYEVVDGNGTMTSAKKLGWKGLPAKVVSREEGARIKADETAGDLTKSVVDSQKYSDKPKRTSQPVSDQKELYEKAAVALEQLTDWLNRGKGVADQMGFTTMDKLPFQVAPDEWAKHKGMLFIAPLKEADGRAKSKVGKSYHGDWGKLLDVVRCAMVVDTLHDVRHVIETLEKHGMQVMQQPKNKFKSPSELGYRDVNLICKMPNGLLAEVQVNIKDMMKAKHEGKKHYEISRSITEKHEDAGDIDDPSKWEPGEEEALRNANAAQRRIYGKAWLDHVNRNYGDGDTGADSSNLIKSIPLAVLFKRRVA